VFGGTLRITPRMLRRLKNNLRLFVRTLVVLWVRCADLHRSWSSHFECGRSHHSTEACFGRALAHGFPADRTRLRRKRPFIWTRYLGRLADFVYICGTVVCVAAILFQGVSVLPLDTPSGDSRCIHHHGLAGRKRSRRLLSLILHWRLLWWRRAIPGSRLLSSWLSTSLIVDSASCRSNGGSGDGKTESLETSWPHS
jgi:hypothetical protein